MHIKMSCYYIFGPKIQKLKVKDKVVVFRDAQRELAFLNQKKKRDERCHGFVDSILHT